MDTYLKQVETYNELCLTISKHLRLRIKYLFIIYQILPNITFMDTYLKQSLSFTLVTHWLDGKVCFSFVTDLDVFCSHLSLIKVFHSPV